MDPFKVFILKDLFLKYSRIKTYSDSRASSVSFLGLVNGTGEKPEADPPLFFVQLFCQRWNADNAKFLFAMN